MRICGAFVKSYENEIITKNVVIFDDDAAMDIAMMESALLF